MHVIASGYGTYIVQRILQLKPQLFDSILLDGAIDIKNGFNSF